MMTLKLLIAVLSIANADGGTVPANAAKGTAKELKTTKLVEVDPVCASIKGMATAKYYASSNECQSEVPMSADDCKEIQGHIVPRPRMDGKGTENWCEGSMLSKHRTPDARKAMKKIFAGQAEPATIKYARKIAPTK